LATTTPNVDVNMYVRFGQDVGGLPTTAQPVADYRGEDPSGIESIDITPSSNPPLQAGLYFVSLRVMTSGVPPIGTLTATFQGGGPVLTSGTARSFTLPAVSTPTFLGGLNAFRIDVPAGASSLTVQLTTTTPNVNLDLYVRLGEEPSQGPGITFTDYSSTGPAGSESLTATPASSPPLRAGTYYIVLRSLTTGVAASGSVTATLVVPPALPRTLTPGVAASFQLGPVTAPTLFFGSFGYRIDVPAGATQMTVQLITTTSNANVDLYVRFGQEPAVVSNDVVADHKAEGSTGGESLNIFPVGTPPLRTGAYYIALGVVTPGVAVTGTVIATIQSAPPPPPPIAIGTASLPNATVGQSYNQTLSATGGTSPHAWSLATGAPPAGINLSVSGVLSGTPTAAGQTTFTVRVTDSRQTGTTRSLTLTVNPAAGPGPLVIITASLPGGTLGTAYLATALEASGGAGPYRWTVSPLPAGLSLSVVNGVGVISGTPSASGSFTVTVTVTDSANRSASQPYTIQISVPAATVTIGGIGGTLAPLAQPSVTVNLAQDYPADITGTLTMTFAPNAVVNPTGITDARFSNGRTADFMIPRGSRQAQVASQVGTVAGVITVVVTRLQSGGANLSPPAPVTATVARAAPVVGCTSLTASGSGFTIMVTGYATPRELTRANFRFTGAAGVTLEGSAQVLADAETKFGDWYWSTPSFALGSMFKLTATFAVDNGSINSIGQAFVTLANNTGAAAEQAVDRNRASCPP